VSTHDAPPAYPPDAAAASPNVAVRIGNVLFHYRNGLFPITFLVLALASRPTLFLGTLRSDSVLDAIGLAVALCGQTLRAVVIGLAYIVRGGKDRRIYAEDLVTSGFFAHSRNPLYVGNMLVYLGLFLMLNSVVGYLVGVPFFLFAYLCITAAEEDFLRRKFGAAYEAYCRQVPRYLPRLRGIGQTMRGMRFNWKRLVRKEYGAAFSWMTTALGIIYWENYSARGAAASRGVLAIVLGVWGALLIAYLSARFLKKAHRLSD
jgi:protein-S-isoprenylcysteine O-methyltransferase Ste14